MKSRLFRQPRSFDYIEREWENQQENARSREMEEDAAEQAYEARKEDEAIEQLEQLKEK